MKNVIFLNMFVLHNLAFVASLKYVFARREYPKIDGRAAGALPATSLLRVPPLTARVPAPDFARHVTDMSAPYK